MPWRHEDHQTRSFPGALCGGRTGREGGGNFAAAKESASRILAKKQRPPRGLLITQNFDWRYSSSYSSYLSPGGSGWGLSATRSLIETDFEIHAARSPTRIERIWQDTGAVIWALLLSSMLRAEPRRRRPRSRWRR